MKNVRVKVPLNVSVNDVLLKAINRNGAKEVIKLLSQLCYMDVSFIIPLVHPGTWTARDQDKLDTANTLRYLLDNWDELCQDARQYIEEQAEKEKKHGSRKSR